ncbi:hypothetical protein LJR231_000310 [Phyllobacterium sp. LjRoot231]|uniref:hypothetical protein n=1 Tax=Phyllobacterium sp. LjRoot231 TaxID=3342289 RepID=UPI003ECE69B5
MGKSKTPQEQLSSELARLIAEQMRVGFEAYAAALQRVADSHTRNLKATAKELVELIEIEKAVRQRQDAVLREQMNDLLKLHDLKQQQEALLQ